MEEKKKEKEEGLFGLSALFYNSVEEKEKADRESLEILKKYNLLH